ncbi:MAG: phosphatidate cytidylyltransferase [Candidatus Odinarchaeota archaeon]
MDRTSMDTIEDLTFIKEFQRKAFHFLILLLPVVYHFLDFSIVEVYIGVAVFLVFIYIVEFFRKTKLPGFKFVSLILDDWMRKEEKEKIAGFVPTTTNFFAVMLLCWPLISLDQNFFLMIELAIVVPLLGDIFAAITGKWAKRNLSRIHYLKSGSNKTYEGLLAGASATAALAIVFMLFWGTYLSFWQFSLVFLILAGIVAITDYYGELPLFLSDNVVNCWLAIIFLTVIYFIVP